MAHAKVTSGRRQKGQCPSCELQGGLVGTIIARTLASLKFHAVGQLDKQAMLVGLNLGQVF